MNIRVSVTILLKRTFKSPCEIFLHFGAKHTVFYFEKPPSYQVM